MKSLIPKHWKSYLKAVPPTRLVPNQVECHKRGAIFVYTVYPGSSQYHYTVLGNVSKYEVKHLRPRAQETVARELRLKKKHSMYTQHI